MNKHITQKEILLMTGTTFEQKRLEKIDGKRNHITLKKKMKRIFDHSYWSTTLTEILPEIMEVQNELNNITQVSFVRKGTAFIQLEMGSEPLIIDREYSLDPYLFLSAKIYN